MAPKAYPQAPLVLMMLLHMDITAASTHEVAPAIGMTVSIWQIACASQQAFRQAGEERPPVQDVHRPGLRCWYACHPAVT